MSVGDITEKALGDAIQSARQVAGLTQQQLCQKAGISYSTLAKIERGAIKTPSVFTVASIANVLNTSIDSLMGAVVDSSASNISKKTSKNGVAFVYFDINGCLVRFFHSAFTKLSYEINVPSDTIETAFWHYNDAVCRGEISLLDFNKELAKRFGLRSLDWTKYYIDAVEPINEMHVVVSWAAEHYKIGLLSNIMPGFIDLLIKNKKIPDIKYDAIIDSSEVGAIKPEESIYKIAEAETDVSPHEILFVDDSRTNLMAAERMGWKVMWFDDYRPAISASRVKEALEF